MQGIPAQNPAVPLERWTAYQRGKRIADFCFALAGLLCSIPILLVTALAVKLDSQGPVLFTQLRVGAGGKCFWIYKFRTMRDGAENMLENLSEDEKSEFYRMRKLERDPRTTRVGKILRRCCLDELPQLVNVLRGEMSLVGPRPVVLEELEQYRENAQEFLSVRPGMTGYWQVNARKNATYQDRMEQELYYVRNAGFQLDLDIMLKTVPVLLQRICYAG